MQIVNNSVCNEIDAQKYILTRNTIVCICACRLCAYGIYNQLQCVVLYNRKR